MIIVHHLNNSRSQRILWLLEELGLPYEIKQYQRDPDTLLAEVRHDRIGIHHRRKCTTAAFPCDCPELVSGRVAVARTTRTRPESGAAGSYCAASSSARSRTA